MLSIPLGPEIQGWFEYDGENKRFPTSPDEVGYTFVLLVTTTFLFPVCLCGRAKPRLQVSSLLPPRCSHAAILIAQRVIHGIQHSFPLLVDLHRVLAN